MATDHGVRQRLYVAGVVAGLAAVAALVLLILRFGERGASPPSLQAHPNPEIPGRIAYVNPQHCIVLIDAAGTSREELYCIGGPPLVVSWLDARTVAFGEGFGPDVSLTAVDVETRTTRPAGFSSTPRSPSGTPTGWPNPPRATAPWSIRTAAWSSSAGASGPKSPTSISAAPAGSMSRRGRPTASGSCSGTRDLGPNTNSGSCAAMEPSRARSSTTRPGESCPGGSTGRAPGPRCPRPRPLAVRRPCRPRGTLAPR